MGEWEESAKRRRKCMKCRRTKLYTGGLTMCKCDVSTVYIFTIIQKKKMFSWPQKKEKKNRQFIQELDNVLTGLSMPVQGSATFTIKRAILPHVLSNNIHLGCGGITLPIFESD